MAQIDLNNLPNNSKKARSNELIAPVNKKIEKAEVVDVKKVVAPAKIKKKAPGRDLLEDFITEDLGMVANYIVYDIALPTIKTLISDVISNGIDMMLFGGDATSKRSSRRGGIYSNAPFNYSTCYSGSKTSKYSSPRKRNKIDDLLFRNRGEAEEVFDMLREYIRQYGHVDVATLLEMVGHESSYTDNDFGWESLDGFKIERVIDGYVLRVPRPIAL